MQNLKTKIKRVFPFSARDVVLTIIIIGCASLICFVLRTISTTDFHVPLIFVLAVLLISLMTNGYLFGIIASLIAVIGVNYAFTYPYFHINFTMTGYPLTFICMFAVSVITSTLTSRVRQSELMRIEAEREKMRANLLRAISHDFRTPLTSIIGSINAVIENGATLEIDAKNTLLIDAKNDAEWLSNMVENLLSITRIGGNAGASLHKEPQAVEEVVGEAISKFRKQYPKIKINVSIPDEPVFVPMDAMLIEQVIINLLINSVIHGVKATTLDISVELGNSYAVFSVGDNGIGFSKEQLPQLFGDGIISPASPRAGDSTRNMGIGLSVCKTIITAHNGKMKAENRHCGGAIVSFFLPISEET